MAETTNTVQAEDAEIAPVQAQTAEAETTAESVPAAPETPAPVDAPVEAPADTKVVSEDQRNQLLAQWNQSKDRELARVHQQYQAREKALRSQARHRLEQVGDEDAGAWEQQQALTDKAQAYDAMQQQAHAWQAWNDYTVQIASAYGLKANDPRLGNAQNAEQLVSVAKKAMADDAKAEKKQLKDEATQTKKAALDKKVASGELDSLSGAPVGKVGDLRDQYERAKKKVRRGNVLGHTEIRQKYRKLGLDI